MQADGISGNTQAVNKTSHKQQPGSRSALVLFGSETGNAQDAAEEISRLLERLLFDTVVLDLDSIQLRDLLKVTLVIFVVSTAGQGEFPQNARAFWRTLISAALKPGILKKLTFASFGLGDSSYPRYNVAHRMLHGRLLHLGAKTVCERGEGNEQHPEGHSAGLREWIVQLKDTLLNTYPSTADTAILTEDSFIEPKWKLSCADPDTASPIQLNALRIESELPSRVPLPLLDSYPAHIVSNQRVTAAQHFQDVRLLDLHLERNFDYGPGAVAVIHPKNFPEDVQSFIDLMNWQSHADNPLKLISTYDSRTDSNTLKTPSPLRHLDLTKVELTLRWLLENVLDIMSIPRRSFFALLSHFAGTADEDQAYQKERLLELANPELIDELWDYTTRPKRTIVEVMMDFTTVKIPWEYALSILPIMRGRQFSIASGGALTKTPSGQTRVQLLIAIVDPPSLIIKWRRRYGVCTRYIASLQVGQDITIGMQPGYLSVEPSDIDTPVVMVGPGTGVAPMRAMIHHRIVLAQQHSSRQPGKRLYGDTLFFGCRSRHDDFFFKDEWNSFTTQDALVVHTAFSRDTNMTKRYVQDDLRANAESVARTLVDLQGKFYLCGSSGNMPRGVREALLEILGGHSSIASSSDAEAFLDRMEKIGRYKQETW